MMRFFYMSKRNGVRFLLELAGEDDGMSCPFGSPFFQDWFKPDGGVVFYAFFPILEQVALA